MANLGKVVYLSEQQKNELFTNNTITVDGVTINYSDNDIYATPGDESVDTSFYCSATLSSAGWYRVLHVANPTGSISRVIDLTITRNYVNANNESHCIKYIGNYNSHSFNDEVSKSNTILVDKVRYTTDSNYGYVDIHYAGTSANKIAVDFECYADIGLKQSCVAESLQSVADAPSGETVVLEYEFTSNTSIVDVVTSGNVRHSYRRSGNVVVIGMQSLGGTSLSQNVQTTVATLPVGLRPLETINFSADNTGGSINIGGMVQTNGNVDLYATGSSTSYWRFSVSYIV